MKCCDICKSCKNVKTLKIDIESEVGGFITLKYLDVCEECLKKIKEENKLFKASS